MCHGYNQYEPRLNDEKDGVRKFWHEATPKRCMKHTITKRHSFYTVEFCFDIHAKPSTESDLTFLVILNGCKKLGTRVRIEG